MHYAHLGHYSDNSHACIMIMMMKPDGSVILGIRDISEIQGKCVDGIFKCPKVKFFGQKCLLAAEIWLHIASYYEASGPFLRGGVLAHLLMVQQLYTYWIQRILG